MNVLSYGIKIWTDLSSVLSGITRVTDRQTDGRTNGRTDGQTDRILIARPRLHYMQRGKNVASNDALLLESEAGKNLGFFEKVFRFSGFKFFSVFV